MFKLTRGEELAALIAVALVGVATAAVCLLRGDRGKTIEIPLNNPAGISVQAEKRDGRGRIMVHISGEVLRKGVLELSAGSRAKDAVELAGPTENADLDALNLAAFLVDGERIVVPRKGTAASARRAWPRAKMAGTVNVNTASQQQLESLPGIGPVIAGRIIEFRKTRRFENVDDLLLIKGIGPTILERIREYVSVK